MAARLRLGNEAMRDPLATLVDHVADQRLLLVLDDCEHLLDACAALVTAVLHAAPDVQVLATSRQTLGVGGECVFPVPPLVLSQDGGLPEQCEAVALFADRAAAVRPDFRLTAGRAAVVAEICRRLDGVPLAIELAAAQLRALSPEEVLSRLDDRFRMLTAGSRAALPRQRTLRAAIDWSHDLCTNEERLLWARLSMFPGSFDLDAVEQICTGPVLERGGLLGVLVGLVDKSVLACEEGGARMRYWLLDTLREYGREQLAASGEEHALRERHRDHYLRVAEAAEAEWFGPDQTAWFTRLRMEHPQFRSALEFCAEEPGAAAAALGLAASLWIHRLGFGSFNEGRRWLGRALARDDETSPVQVKALFVDGLLAVLQGDLGAARALVEHCRALLPALGDDPDLSRATVTLDGLVALFEGDFRRAVALLEDALARHQAAGDAGNAAVMSFMLTTACVHLDDPAATVHAERCLALCEAHDAQNGRGPTRSGSWAWTTSAAAATGAPRRWCGRRCGTSRCPTTSGVWRSAWRCWAGVRPRRGAVNGPPRWWAPPGRPGRSPGPRSPGSAICRRATSGARPPCAPSWATPRSRRPSGPGGSSPSNSPSPTPWRSPALPARRRPRGRRRRG
ncbi:hypothetical protein Stsp01_04700 [Streptomyces sp. NBRC 13847]|uniref:ATP-binding protein n=1 Tax=Streptomyces TaxID=1883 RepID=UPI0024A13349|nr:hypothetical protein [Streptomyces sp. NBRC 13847]GLW13727.1 hypothetical protein Stsp01_04700 [Streptomyces sp. NBRC 13847]